MKKCAFTLVELLVVIAIISVLAAMLLPTLSEALELGRRVACANNQKQIYLLLGLYASDFNDAVPETGVSYDDNDIGRLYRLSNNYSATSKLFFFRNYLSMPEVGMSGLNMYYFSGGTDRVVFCPSAKSLIWTSGTVKSNGYIGYALDGFSTIPFSFANAANGSAKFSRMTNKFGYTSMVRDVFINSATVPGPGSVGLLNGNNHNNAGGNAIRSDGACRWYEKYQWRAATGGGWFPPELVRQQAGAYVSNPIHRGQFAVGANRWSWEKQAFTSFGGAYGVYNDPKTIDVMATYGYRH